ncbi:alpha/beta hydrolase family protein [Paraflavitalea speifideaquila]|uniref:alpha/beta hydrolase family protein n=1 Tax=Paraflavitalea speifideaquila TaxID=3076558 RepID=UPI0028ED21E4|nr:prolyl oligopeptidase family serine peptidase [Paraflavitalea speifideiaquila]
MNSTTFPNFHITSDFKQFNQLTYLAPHTIYNWPKSELFTWKSSEGKSLQGVLYKPSNFNAKEKYPLIINFYEQLSHRLNEFPTPDLTSDNINIPWFVSRGYLVFTPDISLGLAAGSNKTNAQNAFDAIMSSIRELNKQPWIDSEKVGIQGHSMAGGCTNYIITQTNYFKAAVEAAGTSDQISSYLRLSGALGNPENQIMNFFEFGQGRMGASPWERQDLYLSSSPILLAKNIVTPLLIMHNKEDYAVPWMQGVEMFLALRRLKRKPGY